MSGSITAALETSAADHKCSIVETADGDKTVVDVITAAEATALSDPITATL